MAEFPGAIAPPSSVGVYIMLKSTSLLCVTILDVVVPEACRDIFSRSPHTLSKDHSWKRNPLGALKLFISLLIVKASLLALSISLCLSLHRGSVCGILSAVIEADSEPHRPLSP